MEVIFCELPRYTFIRLLFVSFGRLPANFGEFGFGDFGTGYCRCSL